MQSRDFTGLSDGELLKLVFSDRLAYSELVHRHMGTVLHLARTLEGGAAERDDLISEGLLALLQAIESYDSTRGASLGTYVYTCVSNRMLLLLKRSKRIKSREQEIGDLGLDASLTPEGIVLIREELGEVMSLAGKILTDMERAVFLEYLAGSSYREIACRLGITEKAVGNALSRVRTKLRVKLR